MPWITQLLALIRTLVSILHVLGVDHRWLTLYRNGFARRLTDVHGRVLHDILA